MVMTMERRLLLIGPLPPPITGVSLANNIVHKKIGKIFPIHVSCINMSYPTFKEDVGRFNYKKAFVYSKRYLELYKISKSDKVYITPGQTFWGILKYAPFILYAKLLKKELIVHIHGDYLWQEYKKLTGVKKEIFKFLFSQFDKGIVLSKSLRKNLIPFLPDNKIFELPNFVEDYLFEINLERKLSQNFSELRIIYLSNLMKEKGILDLLEALLILKERNIHFNAKLAGNIDKGLEKEITKYLKKLEGNVKYLGVVSGYKKKKLLEWGNIFVFPTYYKMEGQPISILEAYATGNIVLTTNHAGIPDIFKENLNGFYVKKKSPQSLAQVLVKVKRNLEQYKYIAFNNRKEAESKYRVSRFLEDFKNILEEQ
ncbi:glycosyltransferase family 4 protein [Desulfurobacterium sp. TC5-1]|uniref:glycosyltransferase family 4 protein n=1 Tax=Desulfurobacterium sp. TC5-1 TaxID=1158318 RepID=UPI0003B421D5|nr:glycosyltransferase family 4 protein [Desulfurobacterium sp. TC5-1]